MVTQQPFQVLFTESLWSQMFPESQPGSDGIVTVLGPLGKPRGL